MLKDFYNKIKSKDIKDFIEECRWINRYTKRYWRAILYYCIMGVLGTVFGLGMSYMSKRLIDAVTGFDTANLISLAIFMICMGLGTTLTSCVTSRINALVSVKISNEIQAEIFDKIVDTEWEELYEFQSGDLINRLNGDVGTVGGTAIGWIPTLIIQVCQFLGTLGLILYYDPVMALISLLSAPISVLISKAILKKMREFNKKMREASSDLMSFQNDTFNNLQSVKSFGVVAFFKDKMKDYQDNYKRIALDYNKMSILTNALMSIVSMISGYGAMGWAVYRLFTHSITYGTMTMFLQLGNTLKGAFSGLVGIIPSAISATTSARRVMDVAELKKEEYIVPEIAEKIIEEESNQGIKLILDHASFSYSDGKNVVNDASMTVDTGQIVALMGPSGEGKTTLLRIILGLVNPSEGGAYIQSESTGRSCICSPSTRMAFSYVPQGNTMFSGTIAENMRIVKPDATDEEIVNALKIACAWDFVEKLEDTIEATVKERGKGISEGQAQRIAIARAVLREAPIILFDEATSALDVETEKRVIENILSNTTKTCLIATHRPSVLKLCDAVYKVEKGSLFQMTQDQINIISEMY